MNLILTANPSPPFNLIQIVPAYEGREFSGWTAEAVLQHVIQKNKESGIIPCETDSERLSCIDAFASKHPTLPVIDLPPVGEYWVIDELQLPGGGFASVDTTHFFDAWEMVKGQPEVNMAAARGIHMDTIRAARNTELAAKDIVFMRAVEAGDTDAQSTIATEKQTLRDIPQTFDLTTDNDTPEELLAMWPSELS